MPSRRATACAVVRLSPVSMTTRMPSARSAVERARRRRLDRVGDGDDAGRLAVDADEDRGRAVARAARRLRRRARAVSTPCSARKLRIAERDALALDGAERALAGGRVEVARRRRVRCPRCSAAATMAAASGCSLARSTLAASRSSVASSKPAAGTTAVTAGLPSVSVPVLSTTSVSTFSRRSSASAFLISTPACGAAADADHDRHRRGQAERARAGDDQHRDGGDQRVGEARLRPPDHPGDEGEHGRQR